MGKIMRIVKKYTFTTMSNISRHLQNMNTQNFETILMYLQVTRVPESFTTHTTVVWPLPNMCMLSAINTYFMVIFNLKNFPKWPSQKIGMELPLYTAYNPKRHQVSKHVQFQCVFPSAEWQVFEYKRVLWHDLRKQSLER
jgi:hypothetical protein